MHKKTRIMILTVLFLALLAGGGGAVFLRQRTLDQRALDSRARGMEAARADNYKVALHEIGTYLQRFGQENDAEALYEYARARANIKLPNDKHIQQSISFLLRAVELDPNLTAAQYELLELYDMARYGQETLALAQKLLARNPDDISALRAEANALARLREFDKALERTARIAELAPLDIENHIRTLALMQQTSATAEAILGYPKSQEKLDPEQPAYQLVQAVAYQLTGNPAGGPEGIPAEAKEWARRAAESVQPDSPDVLLVNRFLDNIGLFDDSLKLLARTAPASDNAKLREVYCQRLFEVGDVRAVMTQTEGKPYPEMESPVLALRAMACGRENNTEELKKIVDELDGRTDDTVADTWAPVLRAIWLSDGQTPQEVVRICSSAVASEPENPFFHYFHGLANEQLGEKEQAIVAWQNAIRYAPAWIDPIMRAASLLAGIGRQPEALLLVQAVLKRAPSNVNVLASAAEIIGADIDGLSAGGQQNLLKLSQQVQATRPLESRTLPLVVDLLARQGDIAAATGIVQSALQSEEKFPENTLLRLAQLSDRYGLGLAQACFDKLNTSTGTTPASAYAQAVAVLKGGDPEGGREFLQNAASTAGNDLQWQVVTAQYLELMGSKDATSAWAALEKAAQDNAMLLGRILNSRAAWEDTALIERVFLRLKDLTSEEAVGWRTAKARWLLLTDQSDKAAAEAAELLNDTMRSSLPDAQRYTLLASALERLDNRDSAIDYLEQAARIAPDSASIRFELIRLLYVRGKKDQAAVHLEKIQSATDASPEILRRTAALLARYNESQRAIDLLLKLYPAEEQAAPRDMLLAQLYRRSGQLDKAEAICNRFLQEEPNASVIEFTADLLASQDRTEDAQAVLRGLDTIELEPGMRELILAEFNRVHGTAEEANRLYEEAIKAAKDNPVVWRRMLSFQVRAGEVERAIQRMSEASAACPEEASFTALVSHVALMQKVQSNPELKSKALPFILVAIESPEQIPEAVNALEILDKSGNNLELLATEFKDLAQANPLFLTLKMELIRLYATLGRHSDAATLATQSMIEFPNDIESALLAAKAFESQGKWADALVAAREWRRRAPIAPEAADLTIATAQIQLDQSTEALDTIKPYLEKESDDPSAYSPVVVSEARALIHAGRTDEAAERLRPRLTLSSLWRMVWLQLAALDIRMEGPSAAWLEEVTPLIPEDAVDERVALASAWHGLAESTKNAAYRDKARALLESLAGRPDVTGNAILALAVVAERDGDNASAEDLYKRALALDPGLTVALNNLAMRYITDNKNLQEALELAKQAVASASTNANCLDTLAEAQAALGDFDGAIQSLNQAVELEPGNPKWSANLELMKQKQQSAAQTKPAVN